jgi:hypothetical protein
MFDPSDCVLVAIMNNRRDFEIARDKGWYRIPACHAPPSVTEAAILAFYFTKAFGKDKWGIHWYGPVLGHELARRRDLLPGERDHPRAEKPYYQLQLGPLERLEHPIPSLRWRRITFIETSWDRFIAAREINDLYVSGADGLFVTLKEKGLWPEREFELREKGEVYTVDLAIPCQEGVVAICTGDCPTCPGALHDPDPETICQAVEQLGGQRPINHSPRPVKPRQDG